MAKYTSYAVESFYWVHEGDSLSKIAKLELGAAHRYPEIVALNPHITNPNRIYPGDLLLLPSYQGGAVCSQPPAAQSLRNVGDYFKQMRHEDKETISRWGEATALLFGVAAELYGNAWFKPVVKGASAIQKVAKHVNIHVKNVGNEFVSEVGRVKTQAAQMNGSQVYQQIVKVQDRLDQKLTRLVGQSLRDNLPARRFNTRALRLHVQGRADLPEEIMGFLKNTERISRYVKNAGNVLVTLNFGKAIYDCVNDVRDGDGNYKACASGVGGFAGGAIVGSVASAIIVASGISLVPMIMVTIGAVALGSVASDLSRKSVAHAYDWINH